MAGFGNLILPSDGKCRELKVGFYYSLNDVIIATYNNVKLMGIVTSTTGFKCDNVLNNFLDITKIQIISDLYIENTEVPTPGVFNNKVVYRKVITSVINQGTNINVDIQLDPIKIANIVNYEAKFKDNYGYQYMFIDLVRDEDNKINISIPNTTQGTMYITLEYIK